MEQQGFLRRIGGETGGNVLAIAAAAMIPFTIMVGSALDLSVTYMARGKLQNACDAAALAARQSMIGTDFDEDVEAEGDRFFAFNFPSGTAGTTADGTSFELTQDADSPSQLNGTASSEVPTSLINIIGIDHLDISVDCDATRDMGHNDIVLVLDVTGSMNCAPGTAGGCDGVEQTGSKAQALRDGAMGLYDALDTGDGSITRYGIVPYSHTVNVGRSLQNRDILDDQTYQNGSWSYRECTRPNTWSGWTCTMRSNRTSLPGIGYSADRRSFWDQHSFNNTGPRTVNIQNSSWNNGTGGGANGNRQGFRTSGVACIEERATIDPTNLAPAGSLLIRDYVTRADIDALPRNGNDAVRQFGRYDPAVQRGHMQAGCPAESTRLQEYDLKGDFEDDIEAATATLTGGTYHDVGMLWGTRFASRTGFFQGENFNQGDNITTISGVPVNTHIIFMTDGAIDTDDADGSWNLYTAHGLEFYQNRTRGTASANVDQHLARFASVCDQARQMGITVWVIALDEDDTDDIRSCATSDEHFYTSDGSDLVEVFQAIGQGIGNLRLTR